MCRWVAYLGSAIRPQELLYAPEHSLIRQSKTSKFNDNGLNGDGFGMGWYDGLPAPGVYRSTTPAWSDRNLREICAHIECEIFIAHIRAGTGSPVQETNCNPFRYGRWIFVHNGFVAGYERVRREMLLAVDPKFFANIEGTTDSELLFHLALTFGLESEPLPALERMSGFVEQLCTHYDTPEPLQMTLGLSDGEQIYAVRYASSREVNTLFVSESVESVRALYPENEHLQALPPHARAVVSEPLSQLPGVWTEVPTSTALVVSQLKLQSLPFRPQRV
jgi:glutamine amidotransferase